MLYHNTEELLAFLKKEKFFTQKHLGQNFLVNPEVLTKIIKTAELTKEDEVLEIGPGLGILTGELAENAKKVTSLELDPNLIPILERNFAEHKNVEIRLEDALQSKLPKTAYKLVANIPYYITSPILNHFLNPKTPEGKRPSLIVLLVQKEVAEKVCAKDGDHSILSLQVQIYGKPTLAGMVNKTSFFPQPQVDSAILKIDVYPEPLVKNIEVFFKLIKAAFSQKRKTLLNSISNGLQLSREEALELFQKANIDPVRRPQTLSIKEWEKLISLLT